MASIAKDPGGRRRIQFVSADGKRRAVRLGKVSQEVANGIKVRIERLVSALITKHPLDNETANWVADLEAVLYDKLAGVGLLPKRAAAEGSTLEAFIDGFVKKRADVKPRTLITYGNVKRNLLAFFGGKRAVADIGPEQAERWRIYLKADEKLSPVTVGKRIRIARMMFGSAVKQRLLRENPFAGIKVSDSANRDRMYFVTREQAAAVLEACPDNEWRLLFALSRYGGLRCPSEHLALTWNDVDWERSRLRVRSEKTESQGKAVRWVPIFPELRPYLDAADELAKPGAVHIIARYRDTNTNLRTQLMRIIDRAGVKVWPRLFQNLRASRATELATEFPAHVAADWLGHSVKVAAKHYLQTTEDHFAKAAQNAAQLGGELGRKEVNRQNGVCKNPAEIAISRSLQQSLVGLPGLEPRTKGL